MFNNMSYRRSVVEGIILYTLGRVGALVNPVIFPDWTYVAVPLLFLTLQYLIAPVWATRRILSSKRERLSRRFWLLGPCLAAICLGIDLLVTLIFGMPISTFGGVPQGSVVQRLLVSGPNHLSWSDFGVYECKTAALLFALFTLSVICTRLAQGGFLRFTMPAGGNRVTL